MIYNFDEIIDRRGTDAEKYTELESLYGNKDLIPLWVADMDFKAAEPIIDAIKTRTQKGIYGYTVKPEGYFAAVAAFQRRRKAWEIDTSLMCGSLGVVPSICMLIRELTCPEDKIIIQTPVYRPFFNVVKDAQRELLENPLKETDGHYSMDFEDLEAKARLGAKWLILCSPHNPVGRVWTREELERLSEICIKYGIKVIADEIHSDIVLWGNKHIPFSAISEEARKLTFTCIAASKTFNLAGLQSAIVIFPDEKSKAAFERAWAKLHIECNNCFSLVATQAAYQYGEEWLDQLIPYIEGNINTVMEFCHKHLPVIKLTRPGGTYMLWLDFRQLGVTGKQLTDFIVQKAGLAMSAGTYFGKNGEGFMRMNVACPRSIIEKALSQLKSAVEQL